MLLLDWLAGSPLAFTVSAGMLGLLVGSFLNVVVHRLPRMMERDMRAECAALQAADVAAAGGAPGAAAAQAAAPHDDTPYNLVVPRSRCPHCERPIRAIENIPVLSWLALRGRCAGCGAPIALRYPAVELLCGVLTAAVAWHFGFGLIALAAMGITWALIALAFIDLDTQLLPDAITLPLLWAGLAFNLLAPRAGGMAFATLGDAVIGAMAGYLVLWTVYHAFRLLTGKEGMGYGDFKLLAALGAWMGWLALPLVILLSSLVGAVVGIALIALRGHERNVPIPFGPYIAAAGWIALLWGGDILAWYLGRAVPGG
ncbi:MAG: prepilin peptidase [Chromatiales bacterium]|nr:prepilin peptidase [Chromatiales bacterium]